MQIQRTRRPKEAEEAPAPRIQIQSNFKNLDGRFALVLGVKREGRPVYRREDFHAKGSSVEGKDLASHLLSDGGSWVITDSLAATKVFGKTEDLADYPTDIEAAWEDGTVLSIEAA